MAASAPAVFCAVSSSTATSATIVSAAPPYVASQAFTEISQPYGFNNLNLQTVFRADGTEYKYFTLPANYPLERDVPKPVFVVSDDESDGCSVESVQVFAEEKQHESRHLVERFGKAQEIEQKNCLYELYL